MMNAAHDEESIECEVDLHGYRPRTVEDYDLVGDFLQQAWEMGCSSLKLIHGHGYDRWNPFPQSVHTNTGFLGLTVRRRLRHNKDLRQWMYVKFDTSDPGVTTVRLRPNPSPTPSKFYTTVELDFAHVGRLLPTVSLLRKARQTTPRRGR